MAAVSLHEAEPAGTARPEYQAMVDGYPALLGEFGCAISDQALADLGVLMRAIERIDRILDGTRERVARDELAKCILAAMRGVEAPLPAELHAATRELREMAIRRGVLAELTAIASDALANTERMRQAIDRDDYLACVEREGALTVELALLIGPLDGDAGRRAARFLRAVAAPANLLDKLVDLRGDHRRGEVAIQPDLRTHARLAARLLRGVWVASALHPNRWRFTGWGLRWLITNRA